MGCVSAKWNKQLCISQQLDFWGLALRTLVSLPTHPTHFAHPRRVPPFVHEKGWPWVLLCRWNEGEVYAYIEYVMDLEDTRAQQEWTVDVSLCQEVKVLSLQAEDLCVAWMRHMALALRIETCQIAFALIFLHRGLSFPGLHHADVSAAFNFVANYIRKFLELIQWEG